MKKLLQTVLPPLLTLALLLGVMAPGAGAYTDDGEIVHRDAVMVLSDLGVINGKSDGSYDPRGSLSRAEMAKLMGEVATGGRINAADFKGSSAFTDIKRHWAEGYIGWCAGQGIVSGKGKGLFGPNDPLTGSAAAKMILTTLGYSAEAEGLVGKYWPTHTDQ